MCSINLFNLQKYRKPIACGMASLGLDHCSMLGNTLEEIAWQKSGIFKVLSILKISFESIYLILLYKSKSCFSLAQWLLF